MNSPINIGLDSEHRKVMTDQLKVLLADSYTLYLMTHNFHWNVTGPQFRELHLMFEEHYTELATAVDLIAERIRTLAEPAPGTYREFGALSNLEEPNGALSATEMVERLVEAHEVLARTIRSYLPTAQEANDESTASLLSDRLAVHEKTAWMLRSLTE